MYLKFKDFLNNHTENKTIDFNHDILEWRKERNQRALREFKSPGIKFKFTLPKEQAQALKKLCFQFQGVDLNQTLRKMSEYINENDLFCKVDYA